MTAPPYKKSKEDFTMTITGWIIKGGEVCYTLRETGEDNLVMELYRIAEERYNRMKSENKISDYILTIE